MFAKERQDLEFTREYDLKLDGEIELGEDGYLISVYEGKAEVKVDGLEIEVDDVKKQMFYVDAGIDLIVCGRGLLNVC